MKKSEIYIQLYKKFPNVKHSVIQSFVKNVFNEMSKALANGDRIELRGFGSFSLRHREQRLGRNPRTGEHVLVTDKNVPFFRLGRPLLEKMNDD